MLLKTIKKPQNVITKYFSSILQKMKGDISISHKKVLKLFLKKYMNRVQFSVIHKKFLV